MVSQLPWGEWDCAGVHFREWLTRRNQADDSVIFTDMVTAQMKQLQRVAGKSLSPFLSPLVWISGKTGMPTPPVKPQKRGSTRLSVGKSDLGTMTPEEQEVFSA